MHIDGRMAVMISPKYWPVETSGTTQIHPELSLWNEVEFRVDDYQGYNVTGTIRLHGKRLELDELSVHRIDDGREITGYGLRELQPPAMIRQSLWVLLNYPPDGEFFDVEIDDRGVSNIVARGLSTDEELEAAKAAGPSSQQLLKLVSRIYVGAQAVQDRPAKVIQEAFGVSPRTAGNWIAKSKAAGYIEAGEHSA